MTTPFAMRSLRLKTGELLDVNNGEGITVACLEGSVWITQSNDTRDVVLIAGQAFVLDKPGLALVCAAAGPATVAIEGLPRRPPPFERYFRDIRSAARHLAGARGLRPAEGTHHDWVDRFR
jgi:hypothetical protein